jgi:hypothetical protein
MSLAKVVKAVMQADNPAAARHNREVLIEVRDALNRLTGCLPGAAFVALGGAASYQSLGVQGAFYELSGTVVEVGNTDSRLSVASSGVGVTYSGTYACRLQISASMRVYDSSGGAAFRLQAFRNGTAEAYATASARTVFAMPYAELVMASVVDVVQGDTVDLRLADTTGTGGVSLYDPRFVFTVLVR